MDKYDCKIIEALRKNARIRFSELAKQVNLSAPAVADRVEKLERAGIITGYQATIDCTKLGYPIQCMIELTVKTLDYFYVMNQIKTIPEVTECYSITGNSGLLMTAYVKDMAALQALIAKLMQYGDTKTSMVIEVPVEPRLPALFAKD